jgi:hypothetical protein
MYGWEAPFARRLDQAAGLAPDNLALLASRAASASFTRLRAAPESSLAAACAPPGAGSGFKTSR